MSHGKNATWTKYHTDKMSHGQNVDRQNVTGQNVTGKNVTRTECQWTKRHTDKMSQDKTSQR